MKYLSSDELEPEVTLGNIKVTRSVDDFLRKAKAEGDSKKSVMSTSIAAVKCFCNKAPFGITNEYVLQEMYLKGLYDKAVHDGVDLRELVALKEAIKVIRATLKGFEERAPNGHNGAVGNDGDGGGEKP